MKNDLEAEFDIKIKKQETKINMLLKEKQYRIQALARKMERICNNPEALVQHQPDDGLKANHPSRTDIRRNPKAHEIPNPSDINSDENTSPLNSAFIGFMAEPAVNRYYEQGERIIFDSVSLDPNKNYDASTSTFVCPYTGYYYFAVTISNLEQSIGENHNRFDGRLIINGIKMMKTIAPRSTIGYYTVVHPGYISM